jgi:hypothetical protein
MILRTTNKVYDSSRVPFLFHWKSKRSKNAFVKLLISINNFSKFFDTSAFSHIKTEDGIIKNTEAVSIKFVCREEKNAILRGIFDMGDDNSVYVMTPGDIPFKIFSDWVDKALTDFGYDPEQIVKE